LIENARGSVRSVVGAPAWSGNKLKHLHRAGGDGRIFGDIKIDGHRAGKGAPEIIFLLDLSGSMRGDVGEYGSGLGMKVDFALDAGYEFNKALRGTSTRFAIYGHTTSTFDDFTGIEFIEIKRFEEIVSDEEMWSRVMRVKGSVTLSGNADGVALTLASSNFTKSHSGDKILFIVSDGKPSVNISAFYESRQMNVKAIDAVSATSNVANYLRGRGIKLFSASIDERAVAPCNLIYGRENNVKVDDVDKLVDMVIRSLN